MEQIGTLDFHHPIKDISEYDGIGFDMDHTIARYKLKPFLELLADSFCISLTKMLSYPEEIFLVEEDYKFSLNNFFVDINRGIAVKLGAEKQILRAYFGFSKMSKSEIIKMYGPSPKLNFSEDFAEHDGKDILFVCGYFFVHIAIIFMKAVELRKTNEFLQKKTFKNIMNDICSCWKWNDQKEATGLFYRYIKADQQKFLYKLPEEFLQELRDLRKKGKTLFLVSNSYYWYVALVLEFIIGPEWKEIFDFYFTLADKPIFWSKKRNGKQIDPTNGTLGPDVTDLGTHRFIENGNVDLINDYMKKKYGKVNILFYGDHVYQDCYYNKKHSTDWDSMLILEELKELELGLNYRHEYYYYQEKWGSALMDRTLDGHLVETYWFNFARKHFNGIVSAFMGKQNREYMKKSLLTSNNQLKFIQVFICILLQIFFFKRRLKFKIAVLYER